MLRGIIPSGTLNPMTRPRHSQLRTALLALVPLLCVGCSQPGELLGRAAEELPSPNLMAVAFNHRDGGRYRSPIDGQWRNGDNLEQMVIDAIDAARTHCFVAVQELSLPAIAEALVRARQRGVDVRVVLENSYSTPWSRLHESDLNQHSRQRWRRLRLLADTDHNGLISAKEEHRGDALAILDRGTVPRIDDTEDGSKGSGLMHHKFVVVDQRWVISGSANFTSSGMHGDAGAPRTRGNVNHLLRIDSTDLAAIFTAEFNRMWGDGPGGLHDSRFGRGKDDPNSASVQVGSSLITVLFAPHTKTNPHHGLHLINRELDNAQRSIDLALFVFSAQEVTNTLAKKVDEGIEVRLLADPGFASRPFSEVLDLLGLSMPDRFCKLEAGNQPLQRPIKGVGTPRLARGDKLHHKFAVIDNKTVITGSFNWSPSAAFQNDETLLVIESAQLAKHFTREMDRLWRGAELGITARIRRKLERQRAKCGSGVKRE